MKNKKILFLIFDLLILFFIILYKSNFLIPNQNEFIFSGDAIFPITFDSFVTYRINFSIINDFGLHFDYLTPSRIIYNLFFVFLGLLIPLNIVYFMMAVIIPPLISSFLITFSIRRFIPSNNSLTHFLFPLLPAIFLLFSPILNYRPYWLFLPLIPGIVVSLLLSCKKNINGILDTKSKIFLFVLGYLAILAINVMPFYFIIFGLFCFISLVIFPEKEKILKKYLQIFFWFIIPFFIFLLSILFIILMPSSKISPSYLYDYNVLTFMSKNVDYVNMFTFNTAGWPKVLFTNFDFFWLMIIFTIIISIYLFLLNYIKNETREHKNQDYLFLLSVFILLVLVLSLQLGIDNPIYKFFANPELFFGWMFRDLSKINFFVIGVFTTMFSYIIINILNRPKMKNTALSFILILLFFSVFFLVMFWNPSSKTYDILQPSKIPNEYFNASTYLNNNYNGTVLFIPTYGKEYRWSNNQYFQGLLFMKSYSGSFDYLYSNPHLREYVLYAVSINDLSSTIKFFQGLGIDESLTPSNDPYGNFVDIVSKNKPPNTLFFEEDIYFIPNEQYSKFSVYKKPIFLISSVDYKYIKSISKITSDNNIIFFDYTHSLSNQGLKIPLFSPLGNPSQNWALASTSNPLHGPWHPYLVQRNLENWQSDYNEGLIFTFRENATFNSSFDIKNSSDYLLLMRVFKSPAGGEIHLTLDNKEYRVNTKDEITRFEWEVINLSNLTNGAHTYILKNTNGFNAIQSIFLVQKEEFPMVLSDIKNSLENNTIFYVYKPEVDFYKIDNISMINQRKNNISINQSNNRVCIWRNINIIRNDTYVLVVEGEGNMDVFIEETRINTSFQNTNSTYIHFDPFVLTEGEHNLSIHSMGKSSINTIWIYSVDDGEERTLTDVFDNEIDIDLISEKINPTDYNIKTNSTEPFFLTFTEGYDPLWEARVYKDGQLVKTVSSVPVYGTINGFWIDETGDLDIVIRYKPQDWFEMGLIVSSITFILCVIYLFYSWRLEKEDKWAKKVNTKLDEKIIKRIPKINILNNLVRK